MITTNLPDKLIIQATRPNSNSSNRAKFNILDTHIGCGMIVWNMQTAYVIREILNSSFIAILILPEGEEHLEDWMEKHRDRYELLGAFASMTDDIPVPYSSILAQSENERNV